MPEKHHADGFAPGEIAKAVNPDVPYLGDAQVIGSLLQNEASECMKIIGEPGYQAKREEAGRRIGKIVLGKDPSWTKVKGWNEPGGVDVSIAEWYGVDETDPEGRICGAFLSLISELLDIHEYSQVAGVTPNMWQWQVDAAFNCLALSLVGMSPAAQRSL